MSSAPGQITLLLHEIRRGNPEAQATLVPLIYDELRRIARRHLGRERPNHTLQTTDLVNEAYLHLAAAELNCVNRAHFFAVAATQMRRILVDYARSRNAQKRGGGGAVTLDENLHFASEESWDQILAVHEGLNKLAVFDSRKAKVVELRFFTGLEIDEIGEALEVSSRTVKRDLQFAQAWLYSEMFPDGGKRPAGVSLSRPKSR